MSSPNASAASPRNTTASVTQRMRVPLWITAAAVLGFVVGFVAQYARLNGARHDAAQANRAMQAARLEATLSAAVIEAQSGRYEEARLRASDFYTGLQRRLLPVITAPQQEAARTLLVERDSIITSLARNDPTSAGTLVAVLVRLREMIRQAELDSLPAPNAP